MKYLKMLGLLAIVATIASIQAGAASATTLTSPTGTAYTGSIEATSEGSTYLTGAWSDVACVVDIRWNNTTHGPVATAHGPVTSLQFTNCNYAVTVIHPGSFVKHYLASGKARVRWVGFVIRFHGSIGQCTLGSSSGVEIGTLTGSHVTGGKATVDIENSKLPVTEGSFFCGSSAEWEGSFVVNSPSTLYVD